MTCSVFLCWFLFLVLSCEAISSSASNHDNATEILTSLLRNYDARLRPDFQEKITTIHIGINIVDLSALNEMDMDLMIDLTLTQRWTDKRLACNQTRTITLSSHVVERLWMPDTYFENSKTAFFHDVTRENQMVQLEWPAGHVIYRARITMKASCPMDLLMFPLDQQTCDLRIESYGYDSHQLRYAWIENEVIISKTVKDMPQFEFNRFNLSMKSTKYLAGDWSTLILQFFIKRRISFYIFNVYAPCFLVVVLSWMSFLILPEQTAARVSLGITSVLTMVTLQRSANKTMPKVAYVKTLDWYIIICFVFVFGSVIEYTIVLLQIFYQAKSLVRKKRARERLKRDLTQLRVQRPTLIDDDNDSTCCGLCPDLLEGISNPFRRDSDTNINNMITEDTEFSENSMTAMFGKTREFLMSKEHWVDRLSCYLFPSLFSMFNAVYWGICLAHS